MSLPYPPTEQHFRRYERYIKEIVEKWPQMVGFAPEPPIASVEALASRIRICIKALLEHLSLADAPDWKLSFSSERFLQIQDKIVISTSCRSGLVVCGPYDAVRAQTPLGVQVAPSFEQIVPKVYLWQCNDPDLVKAVIVMHHHGLLAEASAIETELDVTALAAPYDVAVEKNGPLYTIV